MSEERKVNLVFAAENQTKGTLNQIKQDVADTAAGIEQSGKRAAKGIEGLGEAVKKAGKDSGDGLKKFGDGFKGAGEQSKQAEEQVSQATRSMIQSIQRTTAAAEAGEKGTSKYFEALAKQRGIGGDVLEPYIAQLRAAEAAQAAAAGSMGNMGMSAKATSAALRGVPAQLSDIFVSIQGGMPLMTVATQQGLQLRDMFGSFGAAGKAVGTTLLGMVNPFTVAGAAAVALGAAYYQGSQEAGALRLALVTTGNAAGTSVTQLSQFAAEMGRVSGVESQASAALADFVSAGVRGSDMLKEYAQAAIDWEKATGKSVEKTAKAFASLQDEPLKAAMELQKGMNFLTVATYEEIRALDEQGRKTEAAAVAQKAYAAALRSGASEIRDNLGTLERTWDKLGKTASTVWSLMLGAGRAATLADKIGGLQKEIATAERQIAAGTGFSETAGGAATGRGGRLTPKDIELLQQRLALRKQELSALDQAAKQEQSAAESRAAEDAKIRARDEWNQKGLKYLSDAQKLERELKEERALGVAAGYDQKDINERLNAIREDAAKKDKSGAKAAKELKKELSEQAKVYAELAGVSSTYYDDLARGEKQLAKGEITRDQYIKYVEDLIRKQPFAIALAKEEAEVSKARVKAWEDEVKAAQKQLEVRIKAAESVEDALLKAREEERAHQLAAAAGITHAEAVARLALARAEDNYQKALSKGADGETLLALQRETNARRSLIEVMQQKGVREANEKAAKEIEKEWDKTSQLIGQTLSDYIMGGGKDAAQYLKRLFATLVLQPVVNYGVQGAMKSLGMGPGSGSSASSASGGMPGGGFTDWSSWGSTASGWASDASFKLVTNGWQDMGSSMMGLSRTITSVDTYLKDLPGMSGGIGSAAGYLGALYSLSQGKVGSAAGTAIGTYIFPGIGTMIGSALGGLLDGLDDSGTQHKGAGAIYSKATGVQDGAGIYNQGSFGMGHRDEYSAEMQAGISGIAQGLGQTLDAFAVSFGKTAGYSVATAFADDSSKDGSWGSLKIADALGNVLVNWEDSRSSKWAPKTFADGEEGFKQYQNEIFQSVKGEIEKMDMAGWGRQILKTATDIDTLNTALQQIATVKTVFEGLGKTMGVFADLSGDLQTQLLAASGGIEALGTNAGAFYQSFYTEGERAQTQRELQMGALGDMGLYIDPFQGDAAKEMFRLTVEGAMSSGQAALAGKLLAMSASFAETADYGQTLLDNTATAAKEAAQEAATAAASWTGLGKVLAMFSGLSSEVQTGLVTASGGMDPLVNNVGAFNQGFYSEGERALTQRAQQMAALAEMGLYIDPAEGDKAKELFRSTVEEAMASGQTELAAKLLAMSGDFASTADLGQQMFEDMEAAAKSAAEVAAQTAAQSMSGAWSNFGTMAGLAAQYTGNTSGLSQQLGVVQGSYANATTTDGRVAALQQIINLEQGLWNGQQAARQAEAAAATARANAAREQVNAAKQLLSAAQGLGNYAKSLGFSEASGLGDKERLAALDAQRRGLLAKVNTGDVGAMQELQGITSSYLALEQQMAVNQQDYSVLSGRIAAELAATAAIQEASASSQVSQYERQIAAAESVASSSAEQFKVSTATQKLIDDLLVESATAFGTEATLTQKLIDQGGLTVEVLKGLPAELSGAIGASLIPAIAGLAGAVMDTMRMDGSHAGGLSYVPFDGYRAELHMGERVLTAEENRAFRMPSVATGSSSYDALVTVLRAVQEDNRVQAGQIVRLSSEVARLLKRWDANGMPKTREETPA